MKTKCWEPDWIRADKPFGEGNQAHAFFARRSTDPEGANNFVLKKLKRQNEKDRRARMSIEAACLKTLDHPGIAKLVSTNAHQFDDDVELFLITEYIDGIDLEQFAKQSQIDVKNAAEITLRILEILKYCHARDVLHRDIKPCHVILSRGREDDPVLIDFGLAFNEEAKVEQFDTGSQHGVGNRFIILPEQSETVNAKRDPRSDITQCVGILFFLLTSQNPGFISDSNSRRPHERVNLKTALPELDSWQYSKLQRIFDIGFEWDPNRRWQSCENLIEELSALSDSDSEVLQKSSFDERLSELKERMTISPSYQSLLKTDELLRTLQERSSKIQGKINKSFSNFFTLGASGSAFNPGRDTQMRRTFYLNYVFQMKHNPGTGLKLSIMIVEENSELIITTEFQNAEFSKPIRVAIFDPEAFERLESCLENLMLEASESALKTSG